MCGIAGFMLPQPALARGEIEARLWAMIGTLRHRGPDDEGVWTDGLGRWRMPGCRSSICPPPAISRSPAPTARCG